MDRELKGFLKQAGSRVRLRMEPDQIGTTTGKNRDCDGELLVQVHFPGKQPRFEAASDLEEADAALSLEDVIASGRFDRTATLRKRLTAVQLQGRISDLIYSLNITNTDFMPHQFKPLLALLDSPSRGLLVADEVGLGKTIEAGLVWTELRFRTQATRLLVVSPAMLVEKWKSELSRRFGARPQIVDASGLVALLDEGLDPSRDTVVVCSLQGLRPPRGWDDDDAPDNGPAAVLARRLQERSDQSLFDLTVIDEAHYLRNEETASAKLGQLLRPVSEHFLLLSATPINLRSTDLFNLLRLVDPDQFTNSRVFEQVLDANLPLVQTANHLKRERATPASVIERLADARQHWLLQNSEGLRLLQEELHAMPVDSPIEPEQRVDLLHRFERVNLLGHAIVRSRKREVFERRVERNASRWAATMTDAERALYGLVSDAIRDYAIGHAGVEGFLLAMPQRQMSSSMYAAASQWLARGSSTEELSELLYETMGAETARDVRPVAEHVARHIAGRVDLDELRLHDSKFELLQQLLLAQRRDYPGEKILVFSYFRPTLDYLQQRLSEIGVKAMVVKGGDDKQVRIDEFRESPQHHVLLSSEVASEGVDLQFMRVVVNYDLPWNPMKVEQRIGRVDRIGQSSDTISILNLVYADTIDDRILTRLYERLRLFEDALGCTEEVLGDSIATLNRELLSRTLTPEQELARIDDACAAIERRKREMQEVAEHEADLMGLGDYVRANIERAHRNQRRISDRDLLQLLRDYLDVEAPGYLLRMDVTDPTKGRLRLPPDAAVALTRFRQEGRLASSLLESGHECDVLVRNHVDAKGISGKFELLNQFHPLIRMIAASAERPDENSHINAVEIGSSVLNGGIPDGVYAFCAELWTFQGARDEETLQASFSSLEGGTQITGDGAFDWLNALRAWGRDWSDASAIIGNGNVSVSAAIQALDDVGVGLAAAFSRARTARSAENQDRVRLQVDSINHNFERRDSNLREQIERSRSKQQLQRLKLLEAQRKKLRQGTDVQLAHVDARRDMKGNRTTLAQGFVKVAP